MTKDEMQRALDEDYARGTSREDALNRLIRILGLHYGEADDNTEGSKA